MLVRSERKAMEKSTKVCMLQPIRIRGTLLVTSGLIEFASVRIPDASSKFDIQICRISTPSMAVHCTRKVWGRQFSKTIIFACLLSISSRDTNGICSRAAKVCYREGQKPKLKPHAHLFVQRPHRRTSARAELWFLFSLLPPHFLGFGMDIMDLL